MASIRVKICGITRSEDAILAAELGAWAIGFVFYSRSSRYIDPGVAYSICASIPSTIKTIGVFVDAKAEEIKRVVDEVGLDAVQLHGTESADFCDRLKEFIPGVQIIKAIRVKDEASVAGLERFDACDSILLDAYSSVSLGGTGQSFDKALLAKIPSAIFDRIIIAGGLRAENLAATLNGLRPHGLDVSSGVETRPGIKDPEKLRAFFKAVSQEAL